MYEDSPRLLRLKIHVPTRQSVPPARKSASSSFSSDFVFAQRAFLAEHMVVMLSEAVGLVADVLQEPQGERPAAEHDRLGPSLHEDLFLALGQGDDGRRDDLERVEGGQGGAELALAAVDQPDVGERLVALLEALDPPRDDLADRREVVDARRRS